MEPHVIDTLKGMIEHQTLDLEIGGATPNKHC